MAKGGTIQYNIEFDVNKASLSSITTALNQLQKISGSDLMKLDKSLNLSKATEQVTELKKTVSTIQEALKNSYNTKLNSTNLITFNKELEKSGLSVKTIYTHLSNAGKVGQEAFKKLTTNLLTTNLELKESNTLLDRMAKTMSNTIKWGISSSIFNKVTGSIQNAYNYTLKLDKSLNAIRRVSNASAEDMERFAKYANAAAKNLGASTLDYTEGALIYFQQGLSEQEAKKRTDVTVKMANVLGTSSEEVSNYMTAIWNNFDDGSTSLEHFADVITKLGAKTASSSEEIATGLEKFAAVSKTVGLSYEYATAALATVVAQTRQSADTVGTAFKTLFSRIEGLSLGETLDDGVTLNKYSEALRKIGVEIKDSSGNLKQMDTILDEMGNKWQSLTEAQKVATAQTVGGVRQYSQLLALMDNWDKFSENLQTAYNSTGELERQQGIYMESAEAHLKTMEAAFEGLYDAIFDENSIKEVADIITVVVDRLSTFINSIGGGGNALLGLGSIALRVFDDQIGRGLASTINNLKSAKQNITELQAQLKLIQDIGELNIDDKMLKTLVGWKQEILNLGEVVSAEQHNEANELIKERALIEENQQAWEKDLEAAEEYFARTGNVKHGSENVDASKENIAIESKDASLKSDYEAVIEARINQINEYQKELEQLEQAEAKYYQSLAAGNEDGAEAVETATDSIITSIKELIASESLTTEQTKNLGKALEDYLKIDEEEDPQAKENALQNLLNKFKQVNAEIINESENTRNTLNRAAANEGEAYEDAARKAESKWNEFFKSLKTGAAIKSFVQLAGSIGQVASALSSLSHLSDIWNDKDLSTGEKAIQIASILGTALPMLANGIKAIGVALKISVPEVLAIIAAVTVLISLIKHFIDTLNKEERELEAAKKAVEEAQQAYEDLKSTIDSYSDARASIDKLTEGTLEFYQAVVKSNEEAQKLIDTLGLVFGDDYTIGKNGLITIKDEALERGLFEQNQEVYRAQSREYSAQAALEQKSQKALINSFAKEVNRLSKAQNSYSAGAITSRQAEIILSNNKQTNVLLGKIENVSKQTNDAIGEAAIKTANAITDNGVDISSAMSKYLPAYLESEQKQLVNNRQAAITALKGYGTQEQNEQFNQQTVLSQKYIADILNNKARDRVKENGKNHDEEISFGHVVETFIQNFGDSLYAGDFIGALGSPITTGRDLAYEKSRIDDIKEQYLEYTKHWSKDADTGIITDRKGNTISEKTYKEALDKVDWGTAQSAYNEGRLGTGRDYEDVSKTIDYIENNKSGLNETSRRRITEMVLGFQSGANSKELEEISKTLTNEEKQFISDRIRQRGLYTQTYDENGLVKEENKTFQAFHESPDQREMGVELRTKNIQQYLELSEEVGPSQERLTLMAKEYDEELEKQANLLGTSTEALDFFRIAGQKAGKIQEGLSYETANTAAEQYKFNKNYNNAVSVYKKNETAIKAYGKALKNNKEISYDLADAMGEVQKSLKDMGLSLNAETISNHLDDINHLLNGTKKQAEEAYKKLYDLARKDVLKSFFGDKEEYSKFFDDIIKDIDATTPGQAMSEEYAQKLSEMITNTQMTVSEINALAAGLGITIPVEYNVPETLSVEDKELTTKATSTLHRYTGEMPNPGYRNKGDPLTIPVNYSWVETVEDKTDHFLVPKGTNFTVNTNKSNIGGKTNFAKSLGNTGSGKKGGGGGSSSKPKTMDTIDDEADRYHKVNTQISKIENQLKKVQSQQQKLVGAKLIENLNKQWSLLNTQVKNYNEKLKIARGEQDELATKLAKQGVIFNADGTIANYMEAFQAQENYVNGLINQYNKLSKKQQETWDNNKTIDKAKENFNKFKENMDRYDTLVASEIPGLEQTIQDSIDKQIEINVQKFNLELEVTLKMNKATRQWNEWKKTHIDGIRENDILGNANARLEDFGTYYNDNNTGDIQTQTRQVTKILAELTQMDETGTSTVYGDDRQKALDELNEKYTLLMETMTDAKQIQIELHQAVLDQIDASQEAFDKQVDNYNFLNDLIEHDKRVIQLVYGEKSYADLDKFYKKQQENYNNTLDFQKKETTFWEKQIENVKKRSSDIQNTMTKLEQEGKKNTTEWKNAYDQYQNVEEELEKVTDQWKSSVQNFNATLEESLQNAVDKFQNAINAIFEETNKTVTGGLGLDYVNEQWELINKNADRYLDTINKTYGIRELEKKYTDAINKSTNINTQQKLKKIMDEQLSNLKDRDRLTQYELDRANKLYDIELAKVALEDAQMNKSQMRLRRDSQGNYTYQYVANDDAIKEAEDKIEQLYNQLYNFDKERYNSVLNDAYSTWNEYQQKMAEAAMINDPEERAKKELLIQEQYDELMTQIEQDYQVSRKDLQESLFSSLAVITMDSFNQTNKEYGMALTNAEGKTTISFGNISNSIRDTFEGADNLTKDTFDNMMATIESADYKIDGFNNATFDNIIAGYEKLDGVSKEIITDGLVNTWSNGIRDMVEYFIHGEHNDGMDYVTDTFSNDVSSMQELFVGEDGKGGFANATKTGWDAIKGAEEEYHQDILTLETTSGTTFGAIKTGADEAYNAMLPLIQGNQDLLDKYDAEILKVQDTYDKVEELRKKYVEAEDAAKKATEAAYNYEHQELNKEIEEIQDSEPEKPPAEPPKEEPKAEPKKEEPPVQKTGTGDGKAAVGDEVTVKSSAKKWGSKSGSVNMWYKVPGNKFYIKAVNGSQAKIGDPHGPNYWDTGITGWANISDLTGYDTGGYTGTWGNNGRLAMLHQKELVLNAKDTENMLNTVEIMRGLANTLGSNMLSRLAGATASGYSGGGSGSDGILEQNVHIDATFPNVKNATEIEEALNNLVNAASQRAYQRR